MPLLYEWVLALLELGLAVWGLYVLIYYVSGERLQHGPGAVLGLALRYLLFGLWWVTSRSVLLLIELIGVLIDGSSGAERGGQGQQVTGAHFLRGFSRWRLLRRRSAGLVIDGIRRLDQERSFRHLALVAPSGAGKTTGYVVPNLLRLKPTASAVVTDPSGEIYERTSGYLARRGFDIKVLDVSDPARSLGYNPLARATSPTEIEAVCKVLIDAAYGSPSGDQRFWNSGAQTLLSVLVHCLKRQPEEFQNLANLHHLTNLFGGDGRALFRFVAEHTDERTYTTFKGLLGNSEKVIAGMAATARAALQPLSDPATCQVTARESLSFESLRARPTVLFLIVPEHRVRHYGFLLAVFWTQFFAFAMEPPGKRQCPIYAFLDEFGNVGRIPDFEQTITAIRKRRVSVSVILQEVDQVVATYGRAGAATILGGGCSSRLYLPGLGLETCQRLEQVLGRQRVHEGGRESSRALLSADQIRTLEDRRAIYVFANQPPALLTFTPFYRSLRLRARASIPPAPRGGVGTVPEVAYLNVAPDRRTALRDWPQRQRSPTSSGEGHAPRSETPTAPAPTVPSELPSTATTPAKPSWAGAGDERAPRPAPVRPRQRPAPGPPISAEPTWAGELLRESRRARQEVAGLREAIGVHVVTRKEAARILGKSTRTLQRWEKAGLLNRVEVTAPGVHYDHQSVLDLKRRTP